MLTPPLKPMLASTATEKQVIRLAENDRWSFEPKVDGHRCVIFIRDGEAKFYSRQGLPLHGPSRQLAESFGRLDDMVLDSEFMPDSKAVWVFDALEGGPVTPASPFHERRSFATEVVTRLADPAVRLLPSYEDQIAKATLVMDAHKRHAEGVIIRDRHAPYFFDRRTDRLLKYKIRLDVDCVVTAVGIEGKRNLELSLFGDNGHLVQVGTCTALTHDGPKARVGDVVTLKYLYASDDNRLVQPTQPRLRTDKLPGDCTIDQLVHPDKTIQEVSP